MDPYEIEKAGGLYAFHRDDGWYVFVSPLAKVIGYTDPYISRLVSRNENLLQGTPPVVKATAKALPVEWNRLLSTYAAVQLKLTPGGERKRKKPRPPQNLTLYPAEVAVRIVGRFGDNVDATEIEGVESFWRMARPDEEESKEGPVVLAALRNAGERHSAELEDNATAAIKLEKEPASFLAFTTIMRGNRIYIDLTRDEDNIDALQAQLADNYLAPNPPASVDTPLKRTYRLPDKDISNTLKEQCIQFGEWRSALWNWSRDGAAVAPSTHDGNISNLLLFAGYATKHAPRAHRISPPRAFDLSVVFSSQVVLEPLVLGYLRWLRRERRVMFSTTLGYLNSLVVFANFYFADAANASFGAGTEQVVKTGLRRLRSHAHSAAETERKHKPVHPDWLSWRACQWTRRRAARAYLRRKQKQVNGRKEGKELRNLYAQLVTKRVQGEATEKDALSVVRHPLYRRLQRLVCLYLHTISPPVRVSITRCLEFKTTFVKLRKDPSRYVIDLKNNANSASARHKTSSHYRNAILPQPSIERMTEFVDALRSYKFPELKKAKRYVFINQRGEPFSQSAWTAFVKGSWEDFARPPGDVSEDRAPSRQPPPSLCRTMFVTWLNSVPYNERDRAFLEKVQQTAADFQTHTLETANSLYDKDTASYERLLDLIQFCEQWSLSVGKGGPLDDDKWDYNLDSDDEKFDSTAPIPRRERAVVANPEPLIEAKEDSDDDMEGEPSPADGAFEEDNVLAGEDDSPLDGAAERLYQPEAILARQTEKVYKKKKGRYGASRKVVIGWVDRLLVKWKGYSEAESTWESDVAFYQEFVCSDSVESRGSRDT